MSTAHTDLVNEIRLYVSEIGGFSTPVDTPGLLYSRDGTPVLVGKKGALDLSCTIKGRSVWIDAKIGKDRLKGRAIWIDAKTGKDRLKPAQIKFANAQAKAGGIAFAAWSVDDVRNRLMTEGLINA